jgi:dTDP-4-dehydrorhamnose reductase
LRVLIVGAEGMLGRDLREVAMAAGHEVRGLGKLDLDVTDRDQVIDRLQLDKPDIVLNCAAWTDVDGAEDDPEGADRVNVEGAANVAEAAAEVDCRVLYVSTDYVFDGTKGTPYVESDPPSPISAYGRSKLKGEEATLFANPRAYVVRTSWLFGLGGPNFVESMLHAGEVQGRVVVVRDQIGSPTWTGHLAQAIVRLIDSDRFGIHHLSAGGQCSWYDFAREIFDRSGMEVTTLSGTTEMLGRKAPRPPFSVLESEYEHAIELPTWQDGLAAYLAKRSEEKVEANR